MKYMKLGSRPDTFYTKECTRCLESDVPSDLTIQVNNVYYLLHKRQFPLLSKCGLLRRLCVDSHAPSYAAVELHDVPGGGEAFELCVKFCYGITVSLSAHSFVPAFCAAKFLRMTESVEKGNFGAKLEAFFSSCILEGWKDSVVALQSTSRLTEWSEILGIVSRCVNAVLLKILTPVSKVTWSYSYTRPGFKKHQHSAPRDWWTEDISSLDVDLFGRLIAAARSTCMLPPQLIGEALHVYASRWLLLPKESNSEPLAVEEKRKILETIVLMIPADRGSVSVGFLLRLLSYANHFLPAAQVAKMELTKRSGLQLREATVEDLLLFSPSPPSDQDSYDTDSVLAVLACFLAQWRKETVENGETIRHSRSLYEVANMVDSYIQVVAGDTNLPLSKLVTLAEALPSTARKEHDGLYMAISTYLNVHPELCKADKKHLCRMLDCQKLTREMRTHAIKNERLPLRTVVQTLFFEQEKKSPTRVPADAELPELQRTPAKGMVASGSGIEEPKLEHDEGSSGRAARANRKKMMNMCMRRSRSGRVRL